MPKWEHIRLESSIDNNSDVTPFYDPMIGKLIVSRNSRNEVLSRLKEVLLNYKIEGINTNIPMLTIVIENEPFKAGNISTKFEKNIINKMNDGGERI